MNGATIIFNTVDLVQPEYSECRGDIRRLAPQASAPSLRYVGPTSLNEARLVNFLPAVDTGATA